MQEKPEGLTEEMLFNITQRLAASIHLSAVAALAAQLQQSSEGQIFLHQWAQEQRERAAKATAPAIRAEMSQLLGDEYREIVEKMLQGMSL